MRDYAQVRLSIWNDDDFRELSPAAQWLYFLLLTHPTLTSAGVGDWRPRRIAALAAGLDVDVVETAGAELAHRLYIVVDLDTEEYFIRSFHRNDDLLKMPNMATAAARKAAEVASAGIRGVMVHELSRLKAERPQMKGWASVELSELMGMEGIDPSVYPCWNPSVKGSGNPSVYPSGNPSPDPSAKGSVYPSRNPSGNPSGNPSVYPSPSTATATATFTRGGIGKVGGGPGEEGKPDTGQAEDPDTEPAPPLTLDGLAAAHAAKPTPPGVCPIHPDGNLTGEACGGCARAREQREAQADAEANAHRSAIDACSWCDARGMVDTHTTDGRPVAVKCDHNGPPAPPEATETAHRPLTDPNTRRALLDALKRPGGPF